MAVVVNAVNVVAVHALCCLNQWDVWGGEPLLQ